VNKKLNERLRNLGAEIRCDYDGHYTPEIILSELIDILIELTGDK